MNNWFPEPARLEILRQTGFAVVEVFDELPSTSDYALTNVDHLAGRLPALIVARRQTKGRGRGDRAWYAADGALTFSILLGPEHIPLSPPRWPQVSLVAGLAVCLTLEQYAEPDLLRVKWPNDVYLAGRKACGILVESRQRQDPVLCVGVGVNVNNTFDQAPPEIQARAIALTDVTRQVHFLPEILLGLLQWFDKLSQMSADSLEPLLPWWQPRCLLTGRRIIAQQGDMQLEGECLSIDANGALLLETPDQLRKIVSGEIVRW